ncbi:MAG: carboxypeptidase regulatory-like domain-containing protein, partial [Bryobacteraceae bacterium]|nr:carboxypeptidase regulatory-like domain-containing protein [Bryobacteraceae bacterium]
MSLTRGTVALAILLASGAAPARSQTTFASITGTAVDPTGAIISGAKVTVTSVETGIASEAMTNETGNFTIPQLKEGAYELRAQAPGFKEFVARNIVLASRDVRRINITLQVGAVETSVEVSAGATLIETEMARISDGKNAVMLKTLPLNTRGVWAFLALSPNVLQAGGGSSTIRFAGSRTNQAHWAIDGTTMSDGVSETQIGPLANYIESFQEVKIDIANNTAEFGTIGQVTIVSKSGTNELHGSAFDYYSTPWFRARNPFALERGTGISHFPGASLGGPIVIPKIYNGRNRSFFFYSLETSRGSAIQELLNPTVPLEPWRRGDFSGLSTTIYDPSSGNPFPNNQIPASRINSTSQKIQDEFYPLPNFGNASVLQSQNYREMKIRPRDPSTNHVVRIDHPFSEQDSIYGRFTWHRLYNRPYEGNLPTIGQRYQQRDNRAATISYTHMFSPTLLNEFRWGVALNNNPIEGPRNGLEVVNALGLQGLAPDLPNISGLLKVNWVGIGLTPITQVDYTRPGYRNYLHEFQDHVSWFRGKHNFKAGFNISRIEWDDMTANPNLFGNVSFSNRFTSGGFADQGHPYADFLLGIPTSAARAFAPVRVDRQRWQYDFFVTDDIKLTSRLTVQAGLRYELHAPWREVNNRISMFDIGTGSIVVPDGAMNMVSPLFPKSYVPIVEASTVGLPGGTLMWTDR